MSNDIYRVQRRKPNDANGLDHIYNATLLKDSANETVPCLFTRSTNHYFHRNLQRFGKRAKLYQYSSLEACRTRVTIDHAITILPVVSKDFEKAVYSRLYNYLQTIIDLTRVLLLAQSFNTLRIRHFTPSTMNCCSQN